VFDRGKSSARVPLRDGLRISELSILWTTVASLGAIAVGLSSRSLVLIAFGLTGVLDAAGSIALVVHFRHSLRHEAFSEAHERVALRIITVGLVGVAGFTTVESIRRLMAGTRSHEASAGVAIAALSIVALGVLSHQKRMIARRIPSPALLADGWLSATGCLLAAITVAGTALAAAFGLWWIDPVAALLVAAGAVGIAVMISRE
jgi:divalent metal cation (Fe/Co/Zn/Cd) transporter